MLDEAAEAAERARERKVLQQNKVRLIILVVLAVLFSPPWLVIFGEVHFELFDFAKQARIGL